MNRSSIKRCGELTRLSLTNEICGVFSFRFKYCSITLGL